MALNFALAGKEKLLMAFPAVFIPSSGIYIIHNMSSINTQNEQFFNLASTSDQQVFNAINELNNQLEFTTLPNHKFAGSYRDLLDIYQDPRKCNVKIKILDQNWKDLKDITKEEDKISVASGVYSIGTWRINDACIKSGIDSVLWLEQHKSLTNENWRYWTLNTSASEKDPQNYYTWYYQKQP